ncbi:U1 small nuclear ribonucleoprotein A isoform X2 [Telopea speciosissima]|uniref:U1 small nuclear ribonucleoprotein A isoform X2 n=1 Tax=Telopea speciosissima TaxID=54955 RepID=UPI001CC82F49|nr:U1 small nuclear ribonucleoprotein A isoform X2 [Telopea speciosissima]
MDDMTAYYPPPPSALHNSQYPYYPPPPAPPLGVATAGPPPTLPHQGHLPQQYQPQPPYAHYAPGPPQPMQDEVRTLFIAGLPEDVKPREIYNLFREFPGYQSSHLRNSNKSSQAFAFAVFSDQQSAVAARHALNGLVFDLEKESTLYIDLAKSNSRPKRSRTDDGRAGSSEKKVRGSATLPGGIPDSGVGSNIHMPGMSNSAYNMIGYPSTQSHGDFGGASQVTTMKLVSYSSAPQVPQNTVPCPTLFVANLGPACSEQELTEAFSRCQGFLKLKMQNRFGAPVAFVDFQDVDCSTTALNHLQGTRLYSSTDGEGMRLEYAKSRMGLRKKPT